jgi:hypothetical protein
MRVSRKSGFCRSKTGTGDKQLTPNILGFQLANTWTKNNSTRRIRDGKDGKEPENLDFSAVGCNCRKGKYLRFCRASNISLAWLYLNSRHNTVTKLDQSRIVVFGNELLASGENPMVASERFGHSPIVLTIDS